MKVSVTTKNLLPIRATFDASETKKYLESKYREARVLVWNFGYIISPHDTRSPVRKYYTREKIFRKERDNYVLVKKLGITIPHMLGSGEEVVQKEKFYFIDFENVRLHHPRISSILDISPQYIWSILGRLHEANFTSGKSYIHWNLHESNFFRDADGKLGIFDLASMHYGDIEYDFATIYINSLYNDDFLQEILTHYSLQDLFRYKKMLVHTLMKLKQDIKENIYMDQKKKQSLKRDLIKIKTMLWNLA